jgi:hypothetical protein
MPSLRSLTRVRAIPLWVLLEVLVAANEQWREIAPDEREELRRLVAKSRGRPGNLTPRERERVQQIASQLDLRRLARELLPRVGRRVARR